MNINYSKFQMNRLYIAFACLFLVLVFSCTQRPIEYEHKLTIIKDKTIDLKDGNTRYNVAFTDGNSESFSFGLFSKYEVGDTICWEREINSFWYVIDCQ